MGSGGLFQTEQKVLKAARKVLAHGLGNGLVPVGDFEWLADKYEKLFKQAQRLVRFSDRMQNQLNGLNKRLVRSERTYHNLFENAAEGIFRSNPSGRLIHVNPAMAQILGYQSPEHLLKEPSGKSRLECQEGYKKLYAAVTRNGGCKQYQTEIIRKEGDCIWAEFSAQAFCDDNGALTHIDGLVLDITERKKRHAHLCRMANRDGLTGVYNRRRFMEKLQESFRQACESHHPLSLIMIDVDYFKTVNDRFGHVAGDQALKRIASACRKGLRDRDILGRLGGEEFAVILWDVDRIRSLQIAERLRKNVEKDVLCIADDVIKTTVSIGLCTLNSGVSDVQGLLKAADKALYRAKREGRNRVCAYGPKGAAARSAA